MTDLQIEAGTLVASLDERTLSGLLVPFGEEGRTNLGRFTVEAGALKLPRDPSVVTLNVEHQRESPIGRAVVLAEEADGIHATFKFADTDEATAALQEFRDGTRSKLSVEAHGMVLRAGKALAGAIFGAALVSSGAFPSATLMASDVGDIDDLGLEATDTETFLREDESFDMEAYTAAINKRIAALEALQTTDDSDKSEDETPTPTNETESETTVAEPVTPDTTLEASAPVEPTAREMFTLLAQQADHSITPSGKTRLAEGLVPADTLFAELANVPFGTATSPTPYQDSPQWIGELFTALPQKPVISDLIGSKALTNRRVEGFEWTNRPEGAEWAGNGAQVHSGPALTTAHKTFTAKYWAGANSFSREHSDFGQGAAVLERYYTEQLRNFTLWLDSQALAGITDSADLITADNPAGLDIGAGYSALIDGAIQLIANTGVAPTFALVKVSVYKEMLKHTNNDIIGTLNTALGLQEGSLAGFSLRAVPDEQMDVHDVLVGTRQGASLYVLPGSPVRAETQTVERGLINVGLYGYGLFVPEMPTAFVGVQKYTA